jgi:hypothetical protein
MGIFDLFSPPVGRILSFAYVNRWVNGSDLGKSTRKTSEISESDK